MLSNFHVAMSVCAPERLTVGFAANEKVSFAIEQEVVSASQIATVLYEALLNVPALPVAFCHAFGPPPGPAFQLTSVAVHVAAPTAGGVKETALAVREIRNCLVAVVSAMFCTLIAIFP